MEPNFRLGACYTWLSDYPPLERQARQEYSILPWIHPQNIIHRLQTVSGQDGMENNNNHNSDLFPPR